MDRANFQRGEYVIVRGAAELKHKATAIYGDGSGRGEGRDGLQRHHGLVGVRHTVSASRAPR